MNVVGSVMDVFCRSRWRSVVVVATCVSLGLSPALAAAEVIDVSSSGQYSTSGAASGDSVSADAATSTSTSTSTAGGSSTIGLGPLSQAEIAAATAPAVKDFGTIEDNAAAVGVEAVNALAQMVATPGVKVRPETVGGLIRLAVAGAQVAASGGTAAPAQIGVITGAAGAIPMLVADLIAQGKVLPQQINDLIHLPGTVKDRLGINSSDLLDEIAISADASGFTDSLNRLQRLLDQTDTSRLSDSLDNLGDTLTLDNLMRLGLGTAIPGLDQLTKGAGAWADSGATADDAVSAIGDLAAAVNG
ncbi:hypothetical protein [Rhodococcus sp. BH5]|uniref:hypothetical protein n=1 Tax=Rhodococcus sp. BH5 TaxID=2871702 RepID=UPI0022CD3699|nr:hypothetical protein [Rhodococcus sp. BH5]MCZ9635052.1 hypothetical protein [Rhodococcus sp. BH5]